ncbi:hypothetical protein IEU95_06295 [Hoyosella rhizosphaerae]|uniref:Uncharacterized protein n=1 Tax=Hoyosella rhizosphaerae TaxID=1755582 RepID=A0A916U4Z4_9ACTN|nr:hypothetical protein [Hoyosella rhizosphaerae]MBN4926430.1 hypothetical protein [Hoyosella rhizosphaerae]GGC59415.1 hypothetical protein GCM10011410_09820 [Hoyosella rhizosphaerae]
MADYAQTALPLDLVRRDVVAPKLRRVGMVCVAVGALIALLVSLFGPNWLALLIGVGIAGPPALGAFLAARRAYWIDGRTVYARNVTTKAVNLGGLTRVELTVQPGRFRQVHLALQDREATITLPLALYGADRGAELDIVALRRLADALALSELISAETVSRVLVEHLRAEARGAGLMERPLFRALGRAEHHGRASRFALSEEDLVSLLDSD